MPCGPDSLAQQLTLNMAMPSYQTCSLKVYLYSPSTLNMDQRPSAAP